MEEREKEITCVDNDDDDSARGSPVVLQVEGQGHFAASGEDIEGMKHAANSYAFLMQHTRGRFVTKE